MGGVDIIQTRGFLDRIVLSVSGGNGGAGCVSFASLQPGQRGSRRVGPPDGGSGGVGGAVYVSCSDALPNTLSHLKRHCRAQDGRNGRGDMQGGKRGEDLVIEVPLGTVVRELAASGGDEGLVGDEYIWVHYPGSQGMNEASPHFARAKKEYKAEKRAHGSGMQVSAINLDFGAATSTPTVLCMGGMGGFGNPHFVTREDRTPYWATRGQRGQRKVLEMELKTIADVGLVGMPNAGKSTLLTQISNSKAAVGHWAFTTLVPNIGTIELDDAVGSVDRFTMADIPGLIEGASENRGLGAEFLRHVERARVLVYVLDLSLADPLADFWTLQSELEAYRPGLSRRVHLIVANKADLDGTQEAMDRLRMQIGDQTPIIPISALNGHGVQNVVHVTARLVAQTYT